jgi:hypothetical protein
MEAGGHWPWASSCTILKHCTALVQVGMPAVSQQRWSMLQGWMQAQAPAPVLVVFENAEEGVHLEVSGWEARQDELVAG